MTAICRLADLVREALVVEGSACDPEAIARGLGGTATERRGLKHDAIVERRGERSFLMTIPEGLTPTRRRFAVAHTLGHLFLHMGYLVDPKRWSTAETYEDSPMARFGHGEEEHEADVFAEALLMPTSDFGRVAARHVRDGRYSLRPIAEAFDVTVARATARGRHLRSLS